MSRYLPLVGIIASTVAGLLWVRAMAGAVPSGQTQTIQSSAKDSARGRTLPSVRHDTPFAGGIAVKLRGDAAMLMLDPLGRRTGTDAITGKAFAEIPGGSGGEDSVDDPTDTSRSPVNIRAKELAVTQALAGVYKLTVSAAASGKYGLDIGGFSREFEMRDATFEDVPILGGTRHSYLVHLESGSRGGVVVSGGFYSRAAPGNTRPLLTYASPSVPETRVPAGTTAFPIVVFYDAHAVREGFAARLDERDISRIFHPASGRFEKVLIPAHPGRNTLVLTVRGDDGRKVTDRLTVVVPK